MWLGALLSADVCGLGAVEVDAEFNARFGPVAVAVETVAEV